MREEGAGDEGDECDCVCGNECECFNECCGRECGGIVCCVLMFPFRLILLIGYLIAMVFVLVAKDILITVVIGLVTILSGITAYTCEIMCDAEGLLCILAIVFFPVTMVLGVIKSCG